MRAAAAVLAALCLAQLLVSSVHAYPRFKSKLPAIPIVAGQPWPGVGHVAREGGGKRNAFGKVSSTAGCIHMYCQHPSKKGCEGGYTRPISLAVPCLAAVHHPYACTFPLSLVRTCHSHSYHGAALESKHQDLLPATYNEPCQSTVCKMYYISSTVVPSQLPIMRLPCPALLLQDFDEAGYRWTPELCRMDSDGDGFTNGQELGDPDCTWVKGQPQRTAAAVSHPGLATSVPAAAQPAAASAQPAAASANPATATASGK